MSTEAARQTFDDVSPPGSWAEEWLRRPLSTAQLRDVISQQHSSLAAERREKQRLMERVAVLEGQSDLIEASWVRLMKHLKHVSLTSRDGDTVQYASAALEAEYKAGSKQA